MAAQEHGLETITYGVPELAGYVINAYTSSKSAANVVEIEDEDGNIVAVKMDDVHDEITVDGVFAGATLPTVGATFAYNGTTYICTGTERKGENKNAVRISLKGKKYEYITAV